MISMFVNISNYISVLKIAITIGNIVEVISQAGSYQNLCRTSSMEALNAEEDFTDAFSESPPAANKVVIWHFYIK